MRPTLSEPPMCRLRELQDGTYTINDLADMHEALDERAEYTRRYEVVAKSKAK